MNDVDVVDDICAPVGDNNATRILLNPSGNTNPLNINCATILDVNVTLAT